MNVTRRQFFKVCTAGVGGSSIALMGFSRGVDFDAAFLAGDLVWRL